MGSQKDRLVCRITKFLCESTKLIMAPDWEMRVDGTIPQYGCGGRKRGNYEQ